MLPSPTGTITVSGAVHPNCSAISSATVFFPSLQKGLMPVLRLTQPRAAQALRQIS